MTTHQETTDDPEALQDIVFQDIVLNEFPYPIAAAYRRLRESDNASELARLGLFIFRFLLTLSSFALVRKYLSETDAQVSELELNGFIGTDLFRRPSPGWVRLLSLLIEAYADQPTSMFLPELHALGGAAAGPESGNGDSDFMDCLRKYAALDEKVRTGGGDLTTLVSDVDAFAEDLDQLISRFAFLRHYELLYVHEIRGDRIKIESFRGQARAVLHPPLDTFSEATGQPIDPDHFYLRNGRHLLDLHPLVVRLGSNEYLRTGAEPDLGLFSEFTPISSLVKFTTLSPDIGETEVDAPGLTTLINAIKRRVDLKDTTPGRTKLSKETVQEACRQYTENQLDKLGSRYLEGVYVERERFNRLLSDFMGAPEMTLVISGDSGVGKTSLLAHYCRKSVLESPLSPDGSKVSVLWLDGGSLVSESPLANTVLAVLTGSEPQELNFQNRRRLNPSPALEAWAHELDISQPSTDDQVRDMLTRISQRYLESGDRLLLIIDGVNENQVPENAFRLIDRFAVDFAECPALKVAVSTRPQVWRQYMDGPWRVRDSPIRRFRGIASGPAQWVRRSEFRESGESIVLTPFDPGEARTALQSYTSAFKISEVDPASLAPALAEAFREPLLLRLASEAFQDRTFPPDLQPDNIVESYLARLVDSGVVEAGDFDFLRLHVVPRFVPAEAPPVPRLSRRRLERAFPQQSNASLHDLFTEDAIFTSSQSSAVRPGAPNHSLFVENSPLNIRATRLMRSELLKFIGSPEDDETSYEVAFTFEYFFDHFVGNHLREGFDEAGSLEQQRAYCEDWIQALNGSPFLWGAVRNLLASLTQNQPGCELLGELGQAKVEGNIRDAFRRMLLTNVALERFDSQRDRLGPVLRDWLRDNDSASIAPSVGAAVAIEGQIEELLHFCLTHRRRDIRLLASQSLFDIWKRDPELVRRLLKQVADRAASLNPLKLKGSGTNLRILFHSTMLIALNDYFESPGERTAAPVIKEIWEPVIHRLFFVSGAGSLESVKRPARRALLNTVAFVGIAMFNLMERDGFTFRLEDIKDFFPPDEHKRAIFDRMIPHLDAAAGKDTESVEKLTEYIKSLVIGGDHNILIAFLGLAALIAHLHRDPLPTATALDRLLQDLEDCFEPTTDVQKPTAPIWYAMLTYPFLNFPYVDIESYGRPGWDEELARKIFKIFARSTAARELRYRNRFLVTKGDPLRFSVLEQVIIGYELNLRAEGPETLEKIVTFNIDANDYEQIRRAAYSIAIGMARYNAPNGGVEAFRDFIRILRQRRYLESLSADAREEFWTKAADDLIAHAGRHSGQLGRMVEAFEEGELDEQFRTRLLRASHQALLGTEDILGAGVGPGPLAKASAPETIRHSFARPSRKYSVRLRRPIRFTACSCYSSTT